MNQPTGEPPRERMRLAPRARPDQQFDFIRRQHIGVKTLRTSNFCQIDLLATAQVLSIKR